MTSSETPGKRALSTKEIETLENCLARSLAAFAAIKRATFHCRDPLVLEHLVKIAELNAAIYQDLKTWRNVKTTLETALAEAEAETIQPLASSQLAAMKAMVEQVWHALVDAEAEIGRRKP